MKTFFATLILVMAIFGLASTANAGGEIYSVTVKDKASVMHYTVEIQRSIGHTLADAVKEITLIPKDMFETLTGAEEKGVIRSGYFYLRQGDTEVEIIKLQQNYYPPIFVPGSNIMLAPGAAPFYAPRPWFQGYAGSWGWGFRINRWQ